MQTPKKETPGRQISHRLLEGRGEHVTATGFVDSVVEVWLRICEEVIMLTYLLSVAHGNSIEILGFDRTQKQTRLGNHLLKAAYLWFSTNI